VAADIAALGTILDGQGKGDEAKALYPVEYSRPRMAERAGTMQVRVFLHSLLDPGDRPVSRFSGVVFETVSLGAL
jgi:hypothetical protein